MITIRSLGRNALIACLAAAALSSAAAQGAVPPELRPDSKPARVTVYRDRALVTRVAELQLPAGESVVILSGLPAAADRSSFQVSGAGAFALRDVRASVKQLTRDVSAQLRALEDQKRAQEDLLLAVNDKIKEAEAERGFLDGMAKRLTAGASPDEAAPLDTAAWAKMIDFYRSRSEAVNQAVRTARRQAQAYQAEIDRLNREIRALGSGTRLSVVEAELVVEAAAPTRARIELSYLVSGPSWKPDYVLRADSEGARMNVQYRAMVRQNTGEDWDGVALSLSTARPQVGGTMPSLSPWVLDVYRPEPAPRPYGGAERSAAPAAPMMAESAADFDKLAEPMEYVTAEVSDGATAVTFRVAGLSSVASDNKERSLTVATLELPVRYSYAAVPKLSPFAYFRAEATNDSAYPFLPGPAHIYVDGSYVADAALGSVPSGSQFSADLGIDESVKLERVLVRKFDETTGVIARRSKTTWEYEIRVKNEKHREITLFVYDQLPRSANEQIVVRAIAPAYTRDTDALKKLDGEVFEWTLRLAPGQEAKLPLSFSVDYPRGTPITGLE